MNKIITCKSIGAYEASLKKGKRYELLDKNDLKNQVKIRDNNGRVRWYPTILFNLQGEDIPIVLGWEFTTPLDSEMDDWVEVKINLSDGTKRWCSFVTPEYLQEMISKSNSQPGFWSAHTIIVKNIKTDIIDKMLNILDQNGEILAASLPFVDS